MIRRHKPSTGLGNRVAAAWDMVRTSLWFVPGLMLAAGVALGAVMPGIDAGAGGEERAWWMNDGGAQDVINLLSTLLTAIIAMASMVFSITVVALSLAANSYGPRLIRTFRADMRTQLTMGLFVLTIAYLLIVLRSVRGDMAMAEVPRLAATVGTFLSLACIAALLLFIHSLARLIVADEVVRRVRRELDAAVAALPPAAREEGHPALLPEDFDARAAAIPLPREGYVQAVDCDALVAWAADRDLLVRFDFRPGDFVVDGDRKVRVYPPPADPDGARREIDRFIVSGQERTPTQDLEFAIRHLVEVAVRALSPGINDPFTAMAVVDRLRGGLSRLAGRRLPAQAVYDEAGTLRLFRRVTTYAGAVDAALDQIRQSGSRMPAVLIHMLEALGEIGGHCRTAEQRAALVRHAGLVRAAALRDVPEGADLDDVEAAFRRAIGQIHKHG
ncbi:MAG: DUF2254 domain-containing protein [Allosphingosinicella sp.]